MLSDHAIRIMVNMDMDIWIIIRCFQDKMDDGFEIVLEKITNTFIRIELLSTLKPYYKQE